MALSRIKVHPLRGVSAPQETFSLAGLAVAD